MSGLEDEIWQRIQRQREAEDAHRDQQATQETLALEREHEEAARLEQAMKAGQAVIALLVKYNVQKRPIWEQRVVGRKPYKGFSKSGAYTGYQDVTHYFNTGQGWQVPIQPQISDDLELQYSGVAPRVPRAAITTHGRAILFEREIGYPAIPRHGDKGNKQPVEGIVHPEYLPANRTLELLESDGFQDGIASLIREKSAEKQ